MKKLRTMLVILLLSIATTPVMSSSDNHAGLYIAVEAATNGAAMNGSGTNSNDEITNGTIGEVFESVGLHVGYLFPASDTFLIGLDIMNLFALFSFLLGPSLFLHIQKHGSLNIIYIQYLL